jgi:hypothetical protein
MLTVTLGRRSYYRFAIVFFAYSLKSLYLYKSAFYQMLKQVEVRIKMEYEGTINFFQQE